MKTGVSPLGGGDGGDTDREAVSRLHPTPHSSSHAPHIAAPNSPRRSYHNSRQHTTTQQELTVSPLVLPLPDVLVYQPGLNYPTTITAPNHHRQQEGKRRGSYLGFDPAVAADSPQVLEGPPKQDDKQSPKESDHGWSEESPPHALSAAIAGHLHGHRDDERIHLGHIDGGGGRVCVEIVGVDIVTHSNAAAAAARVGAAAAAICHS